MSLSADTLRRLEDIASEAPPEASWLIREALSDIAAGFSDPATASDALIAARTFGDGERDTRKALEWAAFMMLGCDFAERCAIGRQRAQTVAEFFGWTAHGSGYPTEGATFDASGKRFSLPGDAMAALLAHVYAARRASCAAATLTPTKAREIGLRAMSPAPGRIPEGIVDQVQDAILAAASGAYGTCAPAKHG